MLPVTGRSRVTLSFLWLTVIVVLASYSGTLISYLAVDIRTLPFTYLEQVIRSPSYNIWLDTESVYAEIFGVSIYTYIIYPYWPVVVDICNWKQLWFPLWRIYICIHMCVWMCVCVTSRHVLSRRLQNYIQFRARFHDWKGVTAMTLLSLLSVIVTFY